MESKTVLKILKKNWSELRDKVANIPAILAKCGQLDLLSREETETIRNSYVNKTTGEQWDSIYAGLQRRDAQLTINNLIQIFGNENEHIIVLLGLKDLGGILTRKTYGKPPKIVNFVGRTDKLNEIEEKLNAQSDESACQYAVICVGFGGIGKTFLAGKYIEKNAEKYKAIIWLDADHKDELLNEEFIRFGVDAKIPGADLSDIESYKAILNWFDQPENFGCLLVFDNVNNWASIEAYVPKKGCKILITSRNKLFDNSVTIFLEKYSLDDIERLLEKKIPRTFDESHARDSEEIAKFAEEHDYHPLAISHAISYIETLNLTIKIYMKEKRELRNLMNISNEEKESNFLLKSYLPVFETFMLTVIQVHSKDPRAVQYLNMMAFLVPNNIPKKIFQPEVLVILSKYSLIYLELGKNFRIHRLVQDSVLFKLDEKFRKPDEIIYPPEVNFASVLSSTYKFIEKHYPYGKWGKKYITLKSHLLPHFGSLFNKNLSMEQKGKTIKLSEIEVQEVPKIFVKQKSRNISSSTKMQIFDDNPIAEAKKILIKLELAKDGVFSIEEREQMLRTVLEVYQKHMIPNEEQISEVLYRLAFLYIEKSYQKSINNVMTLEFIQKARELYSEGSGGKIISKIIESYKLELMGFHDFGEENRESQLKCYLDAYLLQLASLPKTPEMRSKVRWEKYHKGISLENGVSAGRFNFPGFAHYIGKGFGGVFISKFISGYELEIFVGRGYHNGKLIPGKFIRFPTFDSFQCPNEGQEIKPEVYEILKIENGGYKWVLAENGDIVENAVEGGYEDLEKNIKSYIGRIYIPSEGNPTEPSIGKISSFTSGGCVVPLWKKEYLFPQYEILVLL